MRFGTYIISQRRYNPTYMVCNSALIAEKQQNNNKLLFFAIYIQVHLFLQIYIILYTYLFHLFLYFLFMLYLNLRVCSHVSN